MNEKVLIVFASAAQRQEAGLLEGGGYPFKVGHLDDPNLTLKALKRIEPDLVLLYTARRDYAVFSQCQLIRQHCPDFTGLVALACPQTGDEQRDLAIDSGADALVFTGGEKDSLIARICGLLSSARVTREYLRRSRSLARASAEAADIIVQLEEADRRIREQNEELKRRDAQIVQQQVEIQKHLDTIRHELQLAASLQISLMPSGREYSRETDISLFDRYIPAADLGGDYYDYVRLPGGGIFICVADVTGHGVAPSLVTVQLRALARSHLQNGQSLPAVMSDLNTFMYETFHQDYLMTMAGLVYRPGVPVLEYVGAGHCPLIHFRRENGECVEHFSSGLPLGVMEEADYEASTIEFNPGDRVLLYTDGITEAQNAQGDEFSPERLVMSFAAGAEENGAQALAGMLQGVGEFTGGAAFKDDVTLVLVECDEQG